MEDSNLILDEIESSIETVIADIKDTGYLMDANHLRKVATSIEPQMAKVLAQIHQRVGFGLDPLSSEQVETLLYDTLGLHVYRYKPDGGRATDDHTIRRQRTKKRIIGPLLRYRELARIVSDCRALASKVDVRWACRRAQHFVIQAPAAVIVDLGLVRCHNLIRSEYPDVRMVMTLHIELHLEVPDTQVDEFAAALHNVMCYLGLERFDFSLPLAVDISVGPSWGELIKWKGKAGNAGVKIERKVAAVPGDLRRWKQRHPYEYFLI